MDIKVFKSVPKEPERLIIGTHNGIFHSDEVVAIAIMCIAHNNKVCIVRTRDSEELNKCDVLVDIGGGYYDHHQPGGNGKRASGIPYASAGLVWYELGCSVIHSLWAKNSTFRDEYTKICDSIDDDIISKVDAEDNGISIVPHLFSFIKNFLPDWTAGVHPDYDAAFHEALSVVIKILRNEIMARVSAVSAEEEINSLLNSDEKDVNGHTPLFSNVLKLPCQTIPWKESVIKHNAQVSEDSKVVKFVIFPYPAGGWAAQCVPPSMEKEFEQLVPFPKEWSGLTSKLPEISGIPDAVLCHNGRFFARAESYLSIRKMCALAIDASNSK